jgi:hypothetical protein
VLLLPQAEGAVDGPWFEFNEINLSGPSGGSSSPSGRDDDLPQVTVDGRLLGGWAEVQAAAQDGRLDELLAA